MLLSINSKSQCNERLGYNKQGLLTGTTALRCHLSTTDTALKTFIYASLIKTDMTNAIDLLAYFTPSDIGIIDASTKMKIFFVDSSFITVAQYAGVQPNQVLFMGSINDKYSLLLLKTKPIWRIQITGDMTKAGTYITDISQLEFMLDIECLENYL